MFHLRKSLMNFKISNIPKRGIEEFIDKSVLEGKPAESAGRSWKISELRNKSKEDLEKLWFVLFKERNMLLTSRNLARMMERRAAHPERLLKVRKSMARIKRVFSERDMEARKKATIEFEENKRNGKYIWPPVPEL
jgi:large subunit ribosomal protein L47